MTELLRAIPTLDALLKNPELAASLPPPTARTLLCQVAALLPILIAQAGRETEKPLASPPPVRWLNVEQVVERFGVTPKWLYKNKTRLPYSSPSRKILLFDEAKLSKWFAGQRAG